MASVEIYSAEDTELLPEYYFTVERLMNQLFRLQMLREQGHDVGGIIDVTWNAIFTVIEDGRETPTIN